MSDILKLKHGVIELVLGNIVDQEVDAIVNAANTTLSGGGGVDGAVHRAAGPELLQECLQLPVDENGKRCATAEVRITGAGNLHAQWVIHAVGPFYNERYAQKACEQLHQVHVRALEAAVAKNCRSVAFPAISTGAYRFPIEEAATIALNAAYEHLQKQQAVELVRFVLYSKPQLQVFQSALHKLAVPR